MSTKLTFWGVRGSLPSSPSPQQWFAEARGLLNEFVSAGFHRQDQIDSFLANVPLPRVGGFGTATTCVGVQSSDGNSLVIDAGSGIRRLSDKLVMGPCGKGKGVVHLLMTHFHWDHILGLPFFAPIFIPGNQIHIYSVEHESEGLLRGLFKKPYFPVSWEMLGSKIHFHRLEPRKQVQINGFNVTPYQLDHPDPCWGYRIENEGKIYAHCVDTEGTRVTAKDLGLDLPFYQGGVDLMYFDAQYSLPELAEKSNWGHSASQIGLDIAIREKIKNVLFAHHDPGAGYQQIFDIQKQTQDYYNWKKMTAAKKNEEFFAVNWYFAWEGLEWDL